MAVGAVLVRQQTTVLEVLRHMVVVLAETEMPMAVTAQRILVAAVAAVDANLHQVQQPAVTAVREQSL